MKALGTDWLTAKSCPSYLPIGPWMVPAAQVPDPHGLGLLLKIPSGGWFPLVIAAGVFTVMTTWSTGRSILADRIAERTMPIPRFLAELAAAPPLRVPGTGVYLARNVDVVPHALLQNLRHNKVLHERLVLLGLRTEGTPYVADAERVTVDLIAPSLYRVVSRHGFAEDAEVPAVLDQLRVAGLDIDMTETSFFLGRETLLATDRKGMAIWRERLFAVLSRNARRATIFFRLPSKQVCELGAEIEL